MPMNSGKDYKAREMDVAQPLMAAGPVGGNQGGDFVVQSVALRGREGGATAELGGEQAYALRAAAGGGSDPYVLAPVGPGNGDYRDPLPGETSNDYWGRMTEIEALIGPPETGEPWPSGGPIAFAQNSRDEVRLQNGDGSISGALGANEGMKQRTYVAIPILEAGARTGASTTDIRAGMGIGQDGDPMFTLQSSKQHAIAFTSKDWGQDATEDLSPTMRSMAHGASHANGGGQLAVCITGDITHTLKAEGFDGSEDGSGRGQPIVAAAMAVRRLMPVECERLQGFPDNYTLVPVGKKMAADGPRYKQLGNSWAVPHARWVGSRVAAELARLDALPVTETSDASVSVLLWALAA